MLKGRALEGYNGWRPTEMDVSQPAPDAHLIPEHGRTVRPNPPGFEECLKIGRP